MNRVSSWWQQLRSWGGCLWAVGGALLGLLVLAVFIIVLPLLARSEPTSLPSPVVTVVAFPSATPLPTETLIPTATAEPTAASTSPPSQTGFQIGQLVEITGTEGDGLRLRQSAGLGADILLVALENEVFEVNDGPVEQDGYVWWFLINPYDSSKRGWGVSNYLRSAEG
jgi:hypothetical protein